MIRATLNESTPLQIFVPEGYEDLFARVKIYDANGAPKAVLYPQHQLDGIYSVNWTPSEEGYFSAVFELFTDATFDTAADFERGGETIEVSTEKTNILRLLGLAHENAVLDNQVYNAQGRLVSARLRAYDTRDNAATGGAQGLRFTWTIYSTYDANNLPQSFRIAREL